MVMMEVVFLRDIKYLYKINYFLQLAFSTGTVSFTDIAFYKSSLCHSERFITTKTICLRLMTL